MKGRQAARTTWSAAACYPQPSEEVEVSPLGHWQHTLITTGLLLLVKGMGGRWEVGSLAVCLKASPFAAVYAVYNIYTSPNNASSTLLLQC